MNDSTLQLSVVIPVRDESKSIGPLIAEIETALAGQLRYEIIVVDDASVDGTKEKLAELALVHKTLKVKVHASHRGQSAAVRTGVNAASASTIAMLDGDGQNDPADIPHLYKCLCASPEVKMVVGERRRRNDSWLRIVSSRIANSVRAGLLQDGIRDSGCGMKAFFRNDFLELPAFDHMHRFLPALIQRDGGKICAVPVNHRPRKYGESKYGINNRLWVGIVDLFGVMWLKRRRL